MAKRSHEIKLRLNDEEFEKLTELVKESGTSREKYMRNQLFGYDKPKRKKRVKKETKDQ